MWYTTNKIEKLGVILQYPDEMCKIHKNALEVTVDRWVDFIPLEHCFTDYTKAKDKARDIMLAQAARLEAKVNKLRLTANNSIFTIHEAGVDF